MLGDVVQRLLSDAKHTKRYIFWQSRREPFLPKLDREFVPGCDFLAETLNGGSQTQMIQF